MIIPVEDFPALVQPLLGLPVSLPWKGYGSTIFLELGELAPLGAGHRYNKGQACISVNWDWRVETESAVLFGSSNSGPAIGCGISGLRETTLQSLLVVGEVPEIEAQFSNGHRLYSKAMVTGDPEWSIRLPDGRYVHAKGGRICIGSDGPAATGKEKAAFALAKRTASRWGIPSAEPKGGSCVNCSSFVRLDGNGHLLDYGVCVMDGGPFDGHVVNRGSGCPLFQHRLT